MADNNNSNFLFLSEYWAFLLDDARLAEGYALCDSRAVVIFAHCPLLCLAKIYSVITITLGYGKTRGIFRNNRFLMSKTSHVFDIARRNSLHFDASELLNRKIDRNST